MKHITVLLAEDHSIVREGLRSLLELSGDFKIIGEASNGRQAVELTLKLRPDVVVMDVAMPALNGFEATRQILLAAPGTKILVLSAHSDDEYVARMSAVGASGYPGETKFRRDAGPCDQGNRGRADPTSAPSVMKRLDVSRRKAREAGDRPGKPRAALTAREAEVLQLVAEGMANKQVAVALGIRHAETVEKLRQKLMEKLNIHETARTHPPRHLHRRH